MPANNFYDAIVVGGGFFGCYVAIEFASKKKGSVAIIEREPGLLKRASYNNQARVHRGYHYPRSFLTGLSSRVNFNRFTQEFKECIFDDFKQYYAVGKVQSKITASQYKTFCKRIGAPFQPASPSIKAFFNKTLVEDVFLVDECAFDAVKLENIISCRLKELNIPVFLNSEAESVLEEPGSQPNLKVKLSEKNGKKTDLNSRYVFNCAYSGINTILSNSGLPKIHLKQELTEMALVQIPLPLKKTGITLMCGPFFSVMPFPPRGLYSFSHVRYTPHHYWYDRDSAMNNLDYFDQVRKTTNFAKIVQDAKRYMPILGECKYIDSLWELKTILPQSELDDSRPILFKRDVQFRNLISIMGGKLDNIYDLGKELEGIT